MEQILGEIRLHHTDGRINDLLNQAHPPTGTSDSKIPNPVAENYTRHFSQGEDFFIKLAEPFRVPPLSIHHDVRNPKPKEQYVETLRKFFEQLARIIPTVLEDLTYIFDPSEVLRPGFFHLYRVGEQTYLYLLRIDLAFRPQIHTVIEKGSNDTTPEYETNQLFLEADLIPLDQVMVEEGRIRAFRIRQSVSQTWIGETGRGYFVQGIWIDRELTKFLSKLFLPDGMRSYPYYPFTCKYRAICYTVISLAPAGRRSALPVLHRVADLIRPHMDAIQEELKRGEFNENLVSYTTLRKQVPDEWKAVFQGLLVKPYLNQSGMKEFQIEYASN
ncbi:MAG TPA: hypothetical protein VMW87_11955 [Spirochaetia bacterium]|nr:hypothetical protein [Spirochaetia bacterium]